MSRRWGRRRLPAILNPEHLVLLVGSLRTIGVDGELHVKALLRVRINPSEVQGIGLRGIEPCFAASAGVVVLADEHLVGQEDLAVAGRRVRLEGHVGQQVTLVEALQVVCGDYRGSALATFREAK